MLPLRIFTMSESNIFVTPCLLLDRVRAGESLEDIIIGLKCSRDGLITLAATLSQLWKETKNPHCADCAIDTSSNSPNLSPSNLTHQSQKQDHRSPQSSSQGSKRREAQGLPGCMKGQALLHAIWLFPHPPLNFARIPPVKGRSPATTSMAAGSSRSPHKLQRWQQRMLDWHKRNQQTPSNWTRETASRGSATRSRRCPLLPPLCSRDPEPEQLYLCCQLAELTGFQPRSCGDVAASPPGIAQPRPSHLSHHQQSTTSTFVPPISSWCNPPSGHHCPDERRPLTVGDMECGWHFKCIWRVGYC